MRIRPFIHDGGGPVKPRPFVQIGTRFYTLTRATQIAMDILDATAESKAAFEAKYGAEVVQEKTPVKCENCGYAWQSSGTPGAKTRCSQCQKGVYIPKQRKE